ncbi:MAG TPA: dihydropteroate synthase-like protein, partial [Methanothermococcus okinawensis]|nr:dihydropteroate synthase-like protein [Methanothermococcus okinawensis]
MRILIITGKQAYQKVKEAVKKYNYVDVHMANISIAAFLTPRMIIREIKSLERSFNKSLSEIYDFVLVTGLIRHDLKVVEEETGIRCYKSTREASDIPLLLDNLESIELSTKDYADTQILKYLSEEAENLIREYEERSLSLGDIKIGSLKVGDNYPMRILGEIVHVPWLKDKELEKRVIYYVESGADMIDLGMVSNEDHSKDLERILKIVRDVTDKPVSIDTMNTKELIQGIKLDVDMIL